MRWPAPSEPAITLGDLSLRHAGPGDIPALQAMFSADDAFFELTEGAPARPDEAAVLLTEIPPEVTVDRKGIYVVHARGELAGVVEFIAGYPDAATYYLGLLYVEPGARGHGYGEQLIAALQAHILARGGSKLRLAVTVTNTSARRLYDRLGFAPVAMARRPRTTWNGAVIEVDVLELALQA
ncbi:MAG: GNAT family N-acetyltransferase [Kofleriaceae bacterium]